LEVEEVAEHRLELEEAEEHLREAKTCTRACFEVERACARQKKKMRGGIPDEEILSVEVGLERAHARQDLRASLAEPVKTRTEKVKFSSSNLRIWVVKWLA
jgi:hypothetical protein